MHKLGYSLIAVIAACSLAAAQDLEKKTQTKLSVEDGRAIKVTGCVERNADGGYHADQCREQGRALGSYVLASGDDDLKDHVGDRVEINGKAADQGNGQIKVETKNESKTADGDKSKTTSKAEVKGDLKGPAVPRRQVGEDDRQSVPVTVRSDQYLRTTPTAPVQYPEPGRSERDGLSVRLRLL